MAQLDKASDYESEDWGFKSLQGYFFIFIFLLSATSGSPTVAQRTYFAWMPEWSKGADLRSAGRFVRVGSNPTPGILLFFFGSRVNGTVLCYARTRFFLCLHGLMDKAHPS